MNDDGRNIQIHFNVSKSEEERIKKQMEEAGISNLSAYLRKMALNGYIIHLDVTEVLELSRLLRICSNNLNQYAKKANETGSIYRADIDDLRIRVDGLWDAVEKLLQGFAKIP